MQILLSLAVMLQQIVKIWHYLFKVQFKMLRQVSYYHEVD